MAMTTSNTTHARSDNTAVGIGQVMLAAEPARLTTIVGSCVAIVLYSPRLRLGMLAHAVLPHSNGETTYPAKFADTAVSHMLSVLAGYGATPTGLIAKIAGGACMFGDGKFMQIGDNNARAAQEALAAANVRTVAQHVGGNVGRRIHFDPATGGVVVECFGQPSQTI
jgi:chemotaxis protein CheD